MVRLANVIVLGNRAYLPTFGRTPDGLRVTIEPIYDVDLTVQGIVAALEQLIAAGTPQISPSDAEMKHLQDLLPRAAGVRSWKVLARDGQSYAILWETDRVRLIPSKLDKRGRWISDYARETMFPKDTPLTNIVEAILEDVRLPSEQQATDKVEDC
ncbi:MAG: hypothetical protein M1343_05555 [Chloroflexi bacterium]|nr:hypothetical protein [Chloroflexota bacterium]